MNPSQNKIDINAVIAELDLILSRNEYSAACDFLEKWVDAAKNAGDNKVLFSLYNECIGIYRKTANKENCYKYCENALDLLNVLKLESSISGATTYINCGTACKAFGEAEKSIPFFEKALILYHKLLPDNDRRLAGLYNNFALSLVDVKDFNRAFTLYEKAIQVLDKNPQFNLEQAVTYLNMANAVEAEKGIENTCEEINILLDNAEKVLDENYSETDGNYAFVCEKCAPVFGHYGWFVTEAELLKRAGAGRE
jgi:tetratricopeptide (TPR) repeat protein